MSDVTETLQELMERRLRELGQRRGRGESISLREAYQRMLQTINDRTREAAEEGRDEPVHAPPTYEVFRRIRNGHTSITDATASALATMLDVPERDIHRAAGIAPRLGRFNLPTRADRLDKSEREAVLGVVDAILAASAKGARGGLALVPPAGDPDPYGEDLDALPDERDEKRPRRGRLERPVAARDTSTDT